VTFTQHEKSGWTALAFAFLVAIFAEGVVVHILVAEEWPALAWLLTASSVLTALWFVGDARAVARYPVRLDGDALRATVGWRLSVEVARDRIVRVEKIAAVPPGNALNAAVAGAPNVMIVVDREQTARFAGVPMKFTRLLLQLDDPDRFVGAFAQAA
jgi:hypothetical protein